MLVLLSFFASHTPLVGPLWQKWSLFGFDRFLFYCLSNWFIYVCTCWHPLCLQLKTLYSIFLCCVQLSLIHFEPAICKQPGSVSNSWSSVLPPQSCSWSCNLTMHEFFCVVLKMKQEYKRQWQTTFCLQKVNFCLCFNVVALSIKDQVHLRECQSLKFSIANKGFVKIL